LRFWVRQTAPEPYDVCGGCGISGWDVHSFLPATPTVSSPTATRRSPFGKVEAINGNIRAMLRRGRSYRDYEHLVLKVHKATAERRRLLRAA
jgi:hypothetical protein